MRTFDQIRAKLRTDKSLIRALGQFRALESVETVLEFGGRISSAAQYRGILGKAPFPKRLEDLAAEPFLYRVDLHQALAWRVSVLAHHSEKLNLYLKHREAMERTQLVGTPDELIVDLAAAEVDLGQSIWLLDAQLNQVSATGDNTKLNKIASAVTSGKRVPSLVRHLTSWAAYRSATRISVSEVDNLLVQICTPDNSVACLTHYLLGRTPTLDEELATQILYVIDNLAIIDQYNFLLTTLQGLAASRQVAEPTKSVVLNVLQKLAAAIHDPTLPRLLTLYGADPNLNESGSLFAEALDAYTAGNYREALAICNRMLQDVVSVETIHLCLRSGAALGEDWSFPRGSSDCIASSLTTDLAEVASFTEDGVAARLRLEKLALAYSGTNWASSLATILHRQRHDERIWSATSEAMYHGLRATVEQPLFAFLLEGEGPRQYLTHGLEKSFAPLSCAILLAVIDGAPIPSEQARSIPAERTQRATAYYAARRGNYASAASILVAEMGNQEMKSVEGEASLLLVHVYLADDRLSEALALAGRLIVSSTYFGLVLPIRRVVDLIMRQHNLPMSTPNSVRGHLGVALVLDIYSRQIAADRDAERADSFQDVLRRNGVNRASLLPTVAGTFPIAELAYFLRFVCVPDVLDQSLELKSTKEVEDERVAILVRLGAMLTANGRVVPAAVKEELSEIGTRQVVRETARRLDQSKVYVNVEGIRRSIDVTMRENWNRYRLSQLQDPANPDIEALRKIVENALGTGVKVALIGGPLSQSDQLFQLMVIELRDQFTLNKEFGLNSNLSTNIRHGYVLRELRGPFSGRNLITNKDSESGTYQDNAHWLERVHSDHAGPLKEILDRFSRGIDEQIEHINRNLLRIRSDASPTGLFEYELNLADARQLEGELGKLDSYEEFVAATFDHLWSMTERNLKRVRAVLLGDELAAFGRLITQLEVELAEGGSEIAVPALTYAITSVRQEFRDALSRVADWFTLSRVQEYEDFDLQIAYQAGLQSVRKYYANVAIDAAYEGPSTLMLKGWSLPILARLFFLLLDNAASHGAGQRDKLELRVVAHLEADTLHIRVSNDLDPSNDIEVTRKVVQNLNAEYGQEKAADLVGEEGGSGYPKIWKLLSFDLRTTHILWVKLEHSEFVVEIEMASGGLLV